jgi:PUB domain
MTQCFRELKKANAEPCFELLDKLLKNIIDNNSLAENETGQKYRTVKRSNKKLKDFITNHKPGVSLLQLVGFSL